MKRLSSIVFFIALCAISNAIKAQDTLPKFNIRDINDKKLLITWISPFGDNCIQLAVQRSFDSTHFFSTFYSAQSPELPQNGVTDLRMPKGVKVFYRIFYVLQGGQYFFTKSIGLYSYQENGTNINSTPFIDHPKPNNAREVGNSNLEPSISKPFPPTEVKQYINIFKRTQDSLYRQIEYAEFKRFRDSIIFRTKDTLFTIDQYNIVIKPFVPKLSWRPSTYVFATEASNRVTIHLPLPKFHKYRIVFFEENGTELFEIKQPKDDNLILDNSNFMHGGWFSFDLYEDDKLKEHNKFQILTPF